jgi:Zn-dependent peptidase ImmA (M78 family)
VTGKFFVSADLCKVFSKKGYYSKDRAKNIVFDISIEVYVPGAKTYSLLILIECKNYKHAVPVDDVEEFYQKLQQVSGANVKGILVSTNSFQESCFNFSRSKGIGLVRYYDSKEIKWELMRSPSALVSLSFAETEWLTARKGLTTQSYQSRYFDCFCYAAERYTNSLRAFFSNLVLVNVEEPLKLELAKIIIGVDDNRQLVAYREDSDIEDLTQTVLTSVNYQAGEVSLSDVCLYLAETTQLKIIFEPIEKYDGTILGKLSFSPLEIRIYRSNDGHEREKFTLAHELGHYFLKHSKYMRGEQLDEADLEVDEPRELGIKDLMRMEWQANYFASCLLLPTKQFAADFFAATQSFGLRDHGFGALYVDEQPCNIQSFYNVTGMLKLKYRVSRQVVKLRLKKLGLLTEVSTTKRRSISEVTRVSSVWD